MARLPPQRAALATCPRTGKRVGASAVPAAAPDPRRSPPLCHLSLATMAVPTCWVCQLPGLPSCLVPSSCPPVLLPGKGTSRHKASPFPWGPGGEGLLQQGVWAAVRPCRVLVHKWMVALIGWVWVPGASPCYLLQLSRRC